MKVRELIERLKKLDPDLEIHGNDGRSADLLEINLNPVTILFRGDEALDILTWNAYDAMPMEDVERVILLTVESGET